MSIYIYPKLPGFKTFSLFRIGGNGLANCMFVAARAFVIANKFNYKFIEPTWLNISIGPYLRNEKDKRHYSNLFKHFGDIYGLKKFLILTFYKKKILSLDNAVSNKTTVFIEEGLKNYFYDIISDHLLVSEYFNSIIKSRTKKLLELENFENKIAIHIRLGDYSAERKITIEWYVKCVNNINISTYSKYTFFLFSDGTNDELKDILNIPNVKRVFYGNAIADIIAISKCNLLIGSDSTFSGWGAYLGQVPSIFAKKHYGQILTNKENELITPLDLNNSDFNEFIRRILM